ncbi:MAG: Rrf2 family transcriptional regulator [Deltaproteobacteria bacterium]|nr:Rrf2 family transcriptional regulator [Candidatus Zymogenaceae bacterium]
MTTVLKVSQAASLAVHTMALLAGDHEKPLSARQIAETLHVSEAHLAKVLGRLAREGLVQSTRGPRGGFVLTEGADRAPLLTVFEAIEGKFAPHDCLFETPLCDEGKCIFGDLVKKINEQMRRYLSETLISDTTVAFGGNHDKKKDH